MADLAEALRQLNESCEILRSNLQDPTRPGELVTTLAQDQGVVDSIAVELELVAMTLGLHYACVCLPHIPGTEDVYRVAVSVRGESVRLLDYAEAVREITVAYAR